MATKLQSAILRAMSGGWENWPVIWTRLIQQGHRVPPTRGDFYSYLKLMEIDGLLESKVQYSASSKSRKVYFRPILTSTHHASA